MDNGIYLITVLKVENSSALIKNVGGMNTERKSVRIFGMRDHFFPKYRTVTVFIDDYRFFFELGGQVMGDSKIILNS